MRRFQENIQTARRSGGRPRGRGPTYAAYWFRSARHAYNDCYHLQQEVQKAVREAKKYKKLNGELLDALEGFRKGGRQNHSQPTDCKDIKCPCYWCQS